MLTRYKIYRGKRPAADPLPDGIRQDTRQHTKHPLRPSAEIVQNYLALPTDKAWVEFRAKYLDQLEERYSTDRQPLDELANHALGEDVYLGCGCPTKANPRVDHRHTYLALRFMRETYPKLHVVMPTSRISEYSFCSVPSRST